MKRIVIEVIPHSQQRYPTVGDWQFDSYGDLQIKVSDMGNWRYNFLVARHEMDEAALCMWRGVRQEEVDAYDFSNPDAGGDSFSESMNAPYYTEHCDALAAEWVMSRLLGVRWKKYSDALQNLFEEKSNGNEATT